MNAISNNASSVEEGSKGYAFLLSILPLIMMYKTPGLNQGLTTMLLAVSMIYAISKILQKFNKLQFGLLLPIYCYLIYVSFKSDSTNILLCIAIAVHLTAISLNTVNFSKLMKYMQFFACAAAIAVILQQIAYRLAGIHIQMVRPELMIESLTSYARAARTGYSEANNIYRPCAFFLEPAHFSQYCIVVLTTLLFNAEKVTKKAVLISIGILMTTSGLGFVLVFCTWSWWYLRRKGSKGIIRNAIILAVVLLLIFPLLKDIEFFNKIISRITVSSADSGDYNAIEGRLFWWDTFFGDKEWTDMIFGFGREALPENTYFTGFMVQLYAYGIIGFSLLCFVLIRFMNSRNLIAMTLSIIYAGLLFFANLTGFINIIFIFGFIIANIVNDKGFLLTRRVTYEK